MVFSLRVADACFVRENAVTQCQCLLCRGTDSVWRCSTMKRCRLDLALVFCFNPLIFIGRCLTCSDRVDPVTIKSRGSKPAIVVAGTALLISRNAAVVARR